MRRVHGRLFASTLLASVVSAATLLATLASPVAHATAGINAEINFQGRLLNAQGAVVADGYYNIEFKIYQDGDGQTAGDTTGTPAGALKWTEDYLNVNSQGVEVKNGYLSVQLGSVTPFGSSIDWNQDTLWLSMNIAGTDTSCASFSACTPDGEMLPMKRLSSTPYSVNSGMLGGLTAADFGQLATNQTWSGQNTYTSDFQIQGASSAPLLSADTTAGSVQVGSASTDTSADLFVLDSYSGATDPAAGTDGAMYYNTNSNTFRCYVNGAWSNCSGAQGSFVNLQTVTPGTAQTGNFNIDGTGIAATLQGSTSVLTPLVDTATATTLNIGTTNATAINVGTASGTGQTIALGSSNSSTSVALSGGSSQLTVNDTYTKISSGSFIVQDSTGANTLISTDTTNDIVQIGSAATDTTADLFVVDSYSSATDPVTGVNGAMYYNTSMNLFRCFNDGAWVNCAKAGGVGGSGSANKVAFFNNDGNLQTNSQFAWDDTAGTLTVGTPAPASYSVGDTGPAGGVIFYDKGNNSGGWQFLEVSPADANAGAWGCNGTTITTGLDFGDGRQNTSNIIAAGCSGSSNAAEIAADYSHAGYSDWFLPSKAELDQIMTEQSYISGLGSGWYQSSSENSSTKEWVENTSSTQTSGGKTTDYYKVRPVREVSGTTASGLYVDTASSQVGIGTINPQYKLEVDGTTGLTGNVSIIGQTTIKDSADSAFQVQDALANPLLTANTNNDIIQVGSATANTKQSLFVLNNYSSATDPTNGTNGAMYYNTSSNTFRCYTNGSWGSCSGAQGNFIDLAPSSAQTDSSSNSSIFINKTGGSGNLVQLQASGSDAFTVSNSGDIHFGNNANHTINVAAAGSGNNGNTLAVSGGAAGSGSANGGNLSLSGGAGTGTGVDGLVILSTPTFSTTTNDANCYTGGALVSASCTIAASSVDSSAAIVVGFNKEGQTATLPAPTLSTAGRVVYIIAANSSKDFTLSVNGGGTGNEIAMRQNTSATMIWSGSAWTAAGASSSTTLQAAYDNTLQSAGGAELVVSHTSNTNGLTIRDSKTNPVNGPLLSIQTNSAATLFSVNSNVSEYSSDSGAETAGSSSSAFPTSTWAKIGSATASRYTTVGDYVATGQASVKVATTATANDGVKNTLNTTLTPSQHYSVSFSARLTSGAFTDLYVYYSADGSAQSVACTSDRAVISSAWTKIDCSFVAPSSGINASNAVLIGQASASAHTLYIDNLSVTIAADFNYATDGGVDNQASFSTNWPSVGGASTSRSTSAGHDAGDSAKVVTTGANQGISNKLSVAPLPNSLYLVTVYAASDSSGFDTFSASYTPDGGTNSVACVDYNTQTISASSQLFTKVTCYVKTGSATVTSPYIYFTQTDATGRTFYVDTFSLTLATDTTPNVQIGGGQNGGPTTLFTLDSSASAPIASNNEQLLGSMYYDTTLGKIQCYEATGWGSCGSASNTIVTISPEYTNAVMHGTGVGTMTSDICSGTLHINDTVNPPVICSSSETYNFYKWTSPQASAQTYSIYVTYQLPGTFNNFLPAQTSLMGRTDSSNSKVEYKIYKDTSSGLSQCPGTVSVSSGSVSSWQIGKAEGAADPATCSFAPGDSIVFKIDVVASQDADAYVGNLNFTFTNK